MGSPTLSNEPLKVVLDGAISVGKTVWLDSLTTGHYRAKSIFHTKCEDMGKHDYVAVVKGEKYKTVIFDTNGEKERIRSADNIEIYKNADVIIEFFSVTRPISLEQVINVRIPFIKLIRFYSPNTPILLVGTMSDLKNAPNPKKSYFPSAFGLFVAKHIGAFNYVECSALRSFNVDKVIEEAIWAASTASSRARHDVIKDVNSMVIDKLSPEKKWLKIIKQLSYNNHDLFCTETDTSFQKDLKLLDGEFAQFQSVCQEDASSQGIYISRNLELERIIISHSRNETCLSKHLQPICAMWYTPDITEEKGVFHVFQSSCDEKVLCELSTLIEKGTNPAINLFILNQECSKVNDLLTTTKNLLIRSLVIVECRYGTINFSWLSHFEGLEYLVIKDTHVDTTTLDFPFCFRNTMKHLVLNGCRIIDLNEISVTAKLKNLELLNVANNDDFENLPSALRFLRKVNSLIIDRKYVASTSTKELHKSAQDVLSNLTSLPEDIIENKEMKLVFVGQKKVGKTTLIEALEDTTVKSGVELQPEISILNPEHGVKCNVYDLPGDVEYLNTYPLISSSNSLIVVVLDLSQVILSHNVRSADNLCKLELWLETIASQDRTSHAIIVGTHADASSVCEDILQINRMLIKQLFSKYEPSHKQEFSTRSCEKCLICNPALAPDCLKQAPSVESPSKNDSNSSIPHILGYYEVAKNSPRISELKAQLNQFLDYLMKISKSEEVQMKWVFLCATLKKQMSTSFDLTKEPVIPLSRIYELATENEIYDEDQVAAILWFFHSQGTFLRYEDLLEKEDIVLLDPQWLLDQLRTLISRHSVNGSICDGVFHHSELSKVWPQMSEKNRPKILALFRSVGLCFSISDTEELFPCNLPVGWPDREIWPPVPKPEEYQTSLRFEFSFIPASFFPNLVVEVNKKSETFARNVKPLYYRFHIIYIRKDQGLSTSMDDGDAGVKEEICTTKDIDTSLPTQNSPVLHKVHYALMPYNNLLIVAIRGPDPPSVIPDIRATIETVTRRRYPGIKYSESMLCPECVIRRLYPPASFTYDIPHDGACSKGHIVGSNQNIFDGKYSSAEIVPSAIGQTGRVVGETLEDHRCPKLFVVLPINLECISRQDHFVQSHIRYEFAVHLLCECPDQWHFVDSPGFRIGKPKEFFEKYGNRVCKVLRFIFIPFSKAI